MCFRSNRKRIAAIYKILFQQHIINYYFCRPDLFSGGDSSPAYFRLHDIWVKRINGLVHPSVKENGMFPLLSPGAARLT